MTATRRQTAALVLFFLFVIATFLFLLNQGGVRSPTEDPYKVIVALPSAANLAVKADVRTGGVRVGQVDRVRVTGKTAVAELSLDDGSAKVYRNAEVELRYKSALNEGYVDLSPGGGPGRKPIPSGGELPLSRAQATVQVDEVLSTLDPSTRADLKRVLDGTAGGLRGRGDRLNLLLRASGNLVDSGDRTMSVLAGQHSQTAELIDHFGQVTAALGARSDALQLLARRARTAATAVATRDEQLKALFAQLPPTLDQLHATAGRLGRFSAQATPVFADLRQATSALVPVIQRLQPAAVAGRALVRELGPFDTAAKPLLARLGSFGRQGAGAMPGLDGFLRQLNPLTRYLNGKRSNLTAFLSNYTAATDVVDDTGHLNKLTFVLNRNAIIAAAGEGGQRAIKALEDTGVLSALSGKVQQNPYPEDGKIGKPEPFSGAYERVQAEPRKLPDAP